MLDFILDSIISVKHRKSVTPIQVLIDHIDEDDQTITYSYCGEQFICPFKDINSVVKY